MVKILLSNGIKYKMTTGPKILNELPSFIDELNKSKSSILLNRILPFLKERRKKPYVLESGNSSENVTIFINLKYSEF